MQTAADVLEFHAPLRKTGPQQSLGVLDAVVRAVAHAIIELASREPALVRRVFSAVTGSAPTTPADVLLMPKAAYAKRIGFSVRTLDKFIDAGLPVHGRAKRLRVIVTRADEWLLSQDAGRLNEIDLLAMTNARRPGRAGSAGG